MATAYTPEIADQILARISEGLTVQKALRAVGFGTDVTLNDFYAWLRESEEFARNYAIARECKGDTLAEEALQLSDDCPEDKDSIAKATLQVNTRKWLAGKFLPAVYGERSQNEHSHTHRYIPVPIPAEPRSVDPLDFTARAAARGDPVKPS